MGQYTRYYLRINYTKDKVASDIIEGDFSPAEAVKRFLDIHFPENYAHFPLVEKPQKRLPKDNALFNVYTVTTTINSRKVYVTWRA